MFEYTFNPITIFSNHWGVLFYDLHTTFSDFWVQPDLKMTHAAATYNDQDNQFNIKTSYKIWNRTAQMFGDR